MGPGRRIAILFNPVSGSGRAAALAASVEPVLQRRGFDTAMVPTQREPVGQWLTAALAACDAVVVVGGDGAVRLAAGSAASMQVPLYHCPAGTENLFARHFGMAPQPEAVAQALERGETTAIDLARIDGEPFALMASVGFDAEVVHTLTSSRRGAITHWAYVPVIARTMASWKPTHIWATVDGGEEERLGRGICVVANMPVYGLGLNPVRQAEAQDGLLDATFLPCRGGGGAFLWMIRCWLSGREIPGARRMRGTRIVVRTETASRWQADGDVAGPAGGLTEASIEIWPRAMRIVRPAAST